MKPATLRWRWRSRSPGLPGEPGNFAMKAESEILGIWRTPPKEQTLQLFAEGLDQGSQGLRSRANPTPPSPAGGIGAEPLRARRRCGAGSPRRKHAAAAQYHCLPSLPNPRPAGPRDFIQQCSGLNPVPGHSPARPSRAVSPQSGCTSCTGSPATCRSACGP